MDELRFLIRALHLSLNLKNLAIGITRITDDGLAVPKKLPRLRSVRLTGTAISDNGLTYIESLKGLEKLHVDATRVTAAGVIYPLEQE